MCPGNLGYYNLGTEQSAWTRGRMGTQNSCFGYLQSLGKMGSGKVEPGFSLFFATFNDFSKKSVLHTYVKNFAKNENPGLTCLKPIFRLIPDPDFQKRFQLSIPPLA